MRLTINNVPENTIKRVKRIALTIVCCIPVIVIFGYLTRNIITNDALQIFCFMVIFGLGVLIVELIHSKKEKRLEQKRKDNNNRDVFR